MAISFIIVFNLPGFVFAKTVENNVLRIDCEPTSVRLSHGGNTTIQISIKNIYNESEYIYVEYISTECYGLTRGELSEQYFQLGPNETRKVELYLTASSNWFHHSESANDGVVVVYWGTKLNTTSWGALDWETIDNSTRMGIEVTKDMLIPYLISGLVIVVIIVGISIVLWFRRKNKTQ